MPLSAPAFSPYVKRLARRLQTRRLSSAAYSHKWRKARLVFLSENPLCVHCLDNGHETPAVEVDHIKSAADHPELFFEHANLRALCTSCHSRRTAREQGFGRG